MKPHIRLFPIFTILLLSLTAQAQSEALLNDAGLLNNEIMNGSLNNTGTNLNFTNSGNGSLNSSFMNNGSVQNGGALNSLNVPSVNMALPNDSSGFNSVPANIAPLPPIEPAATINAARPSNQVISGNQDLPEVGNDPERLTAEEKVADDVRTRLTADLNKYCLDYCNILSIDVRTKEAFNTSKADLGFENVATNAGRNFKIRNVRPTILIDSRFGSTNIDRLQKLFTQLVERYQYPIELKWSKVTFPESGNTAKGEAEIRADFAQQVRSQMERIVTEFCPNECKIQAVDVDVSRASMDDIQSGAVSRYLFARDSRGALFVRGVNGRVTISSEMDGDRKRRIENLIRESMVPFGAVNIAFKEIAFPRAATEIQKDLDAEREDPYGLGKLEALLKMIKEHGNTKEVYKETNSSSIQNQSERSASLSESNNSSNSLNSMSSREAQELLKNGESFWSQRNMFIVGGIALALIIIGAIGLRHVLTGKRMQGIIHEANHNLSSNMRDSSHSNDGTGTGGGSGQGTGFGSGSFSNGFAGGLTTELQHRLELDNLRDELIQVFIKHPKVARDVFGRMLRDEGIEQTARYVTIFGEVIVFELLGDADLKKDIATLAEYVHINLPTVPEEDKLQLLKNLKLRLTASKMRQMSSKTLDVFDFLKGKSGRQIYELVVDESPRVQGIVLTQLVTEKRREIFELFEGSGKVDLLRELSNSDLVAREYLINVADALKRKATAKPNFDAENTRGSDVLIDLLERADLQEQRDLMAELDQTNPEAARMLRTRLVTIESLAFLRDGLLIEIFLNMDPQAMAAFLAGTRDHIRRLIFSKAPPDLAAGWSETLENIRSIDHDTYRLSEMQVISKVRGLTSSGLINILEINNSLYPRVNPQDELNNETQAMGRGDTAVAGGARTFRIKKPIVA